MGSGNNAQEMFLNSSSQLDLSPVVEPLRINKPSPSPIPSANQQQLNAGTAPKPSPSPPYPVDRRRRPSQPQPHQQHQQQPFRAGRSSSQPIHPDAPDGTGRTASPAENGRPKTKSSSPQQKTSPPSDYPNALHPRDPKPASLAERRGNVPKPLPDSPGPDLPDKDDLLQTQPVSFNNPPVSDYHHQYFPPPTSATVNNPSSSVAQAQLRAWNLNSVNRISSTSSVSTTRATRGSPPPPETPVVGPGQEPGSGIEARYAAAGIAGTSTLAGLHAQNAAAQKRASQYAGQQARSQPPVQRPWTPTEVPGSQPHGPPTVYQGPHEISAQAPTPPPSGHQKPPSQSPYVQRPGGIPPNALEADLQRMHINSSPPPAYSSVPGAIVAPSIPNEKQRSAPATSGPPGHPATVSAAIGAITVAAMESSSAPSIPTPAPSAQTHPAFANDLRQQQSRPIPSQNYRADTPTSSHGPVNASPAPAGVSPASPPPLPEGWIAHLDPNSGQYYYIHLPTQSTQWEFPKGPTPLNLNDTPLSPVGSTFTGHSLASPGLSTFSAAPLASPGIPVTPGYEASVFSLNSTTTAYTATLPTSGVELYKVAPTNGVYFGPYLRYTNMDIERGIWLGSILLVADALHPPTIHIHQSVDLSANPRQLKPVNIAVHQRWTFYKYDIDLKMEESGPAKWTYAITSHLGCTRYEFLVAGRSETNWRFIATSANDFAINVNANERARLGGVGFMWKDIMQKHAEIGGFHVQLGLGGQIFADRIWKEIPSLRQWLATSGKDIRKNFPWTTAHEEDVTHAYFHYYTSHFDQPYLREAVAQIPLIVQIDDHDIFDGFGSYPKHMQFSNIFKNIGRIAIEMYLLFQHHTTLELLRNMPNDLDLFTITGTGWHFVKYLGPVVVVVGADCRSERNPHQVMAGPTYQGLFPKIALLPPSVQHCIWMISVPVIYPRLESTEQLVHAMATGKRAVTGAYNLLGKVTSSVAGVVGAKDAVGSGFDAVKRAVGKSGLMGGVLSPFGDIDILDELRDMWTHESKDLERTYLIRTLQGIARQKCIRMTFISGAVNVCGAGLVHDPSNPSDHKTMYQLISSPVVNTPPPSYVVKLLHSNRVLYVPANGHRSTPSQPTDTKEDMLDLFQTDSNGQPREHRKLMGRRNYVAIVAFDPEVVARSNASFIGSNAGSGSRLSLAADFMVQSEGAYGNVVKYGPVIIPSLELGK